MATKKPDQIETDADMSDEAIDRRLRDIAQLYRLGVMMQSARRTGVKAIDRANTSADEQVE